MVTTSETCPSHFLLRMNLLKRLKIQKLKKLYSLEEPSSSGLGRGRKHKSDKEKIPRDPNLPKRTQNPFFQYSKEKREVVAINLAKTMEQS